jgi:hypothetical protein
MKPVAPCGDERAFHINHRHSTGYFEAPVGDVGNRSRVAAENGQFSKNSELHSRDLENWTASQLLIPHSLRKHFHFSYGNYGYYCLFF